MRYALLIYSDQEPWFEMSEEEAAKATEESLPKWYALMDEMGTADPNMAGKELDDIRTAKTVRVRDGEVLVTRRPVCGDEGADRRPLRAHPAGSRHRTRLRSEDPDRRARFDRGAPDRRELT